MDADKQVPLQSFTRVHLVSRVNDTAAAAMIFERREQEPLAMALPLEVMGQVLGVLPRVIGHSAAQAQGAEERLEVPTAWVVEALQWQPQQGQLVVDVQGIRLRLELSSRLLATLTQQLGAPVPEAVPAVPAAAKVRKAPAVKKAKPADAPKAPKLAPAMKAAAPAKAAKAVKAGNWV